MPSRDTQVSLPGEQTTHEVCPVRSARGLRPGGRDGCAREKLEPKHVARGRCTHDGLWGRTLTHPRVTGLSGAGALSIFTFSVAVRPPEAATAARVARGWGSALRWLLPSGVSAGLAAASGPRVITGLSPWLAVNELDETAWEQRQLSQRRPETHMHHHPGAHPAPGLHPHHYPGERALPRGCTHTTA